MKTSSSSLDQNLINTEKKKLINTYPANHYHRTSLINNDKRTNWSPIRSVIIQAINKIGRPRNRSSIYLITSTITDQIGQHEALLLMINNLLVITITKFVIFQAFF